MSTLDFVQTFIQDPKTPWNNYIHHSFVTQLAEGTLHKACFQYYLKQDYLYLFQYARTLGLIAFKAEDFQQIEQAQKDLHITLQEIQLHIQYCKEWGINESDLLTTKEDIACLAYTRFVLDCGISGSLAELYAAVAPCTLGYAQIGQWIKEKQISQGITTENSQNPYQAWIDTYASEDFQQAAKNMAATLNGLCQDLTMKQLNKVKNIFATATELEENFWQMSKV